MVVHSMKRKKKMGLATLAVSLTLATVLSGCASNETNNSGATNSGGGQKATSSPADNEGSKEKTVVKIATQQSPNVEDYETAMLTKMIEDEFNVDLQFILLPTDNNEAKTKLALMVASGDKLPDVINMKLDEITAYEYASKGVFVNLESYYNDPAIAVNFNKIPEADRTYMFNNSRLADGHVYVMPKYNPNQWNEGSYRAWINSSWLEKLQLEAPKTTDELYEVLKAFAEKDPNGNQKKDEVPLVGTMSGWGQNPIAFLMNAFTYANPEKSYLNVENGKVVAAYTKPEWKEGLEYMNRLVSENLLSPLTFTSDNTQLKALVNVENGMAGIVVAGSYGTFDTSILGNDMVMLEPLAGSNGASFTPFNPTLPEQLWWITQDSANPELMFRIGDYFYDEAISNISRYGEEGVEWTRDPAIVAEYFGDYEEQLGISPEQATLDPGFWGSPQNKTWTDVNPSFRSGESLTKTATRKKSEVTEGSAPVWQPVFYKTYVPKFPKEFITNLIYNEEELKTIANSKVVIDTYVSEMTVAFVTGRKPFSEWDGYIKELNKMGLEQYLSVSQTAFERTQ